MKNIVHIIDSLSLGGAEVLLRNTIRLLPEFEHTVVFLNKPDTIKNSFDPKVKFYCLRYTGITNLIPAVIRLRQIIRTTKPIIVHS
ncbi:MAG: glycosyltransferase, partial [Bacteroidota bacterium]|nr:glycosyltransferase [Bacteroidota bacterium]